MSPQQFTNLLLLVFAAMVYSFFILISAVTNLENEGPRMLILAVVLIVLVLTGILCHHKGR